MKYATITILMISLLCTIGCGKKTNQAQDEAVKKAPAFTLSDYDGNKISLSDYKGKIVVLEWINYECPFSRYHHETANTMVELAEKYKDKNVVWLGINSTGHATDEQDREFAERTNITYPVLSDFDGTVGKLYMARTTPHIFIIDTKGNIVYNGAIDNAPNGKADDGIIRYADNALGEITSGKEISVLETEPYGCTVKYRTD